MADFAEQAAEMAAKKLASSAPEVAPDAGGGGGSSSAPLGTAGGLTPEEEAAMAAYAAHRMGDRSNTGKWGSGGCCCCCCCWFAAWSPASPRCVGACGRAVVGTEKGSRVRPGRHERGRRSVFQRWEDQVKRAMSDASAPGRTAEYKPRVLRTKEDKVWMAAF